MAATWAGFSSSNGKPVFKAARKKLFGLGQMAIFTLAISECLEKDGFACTRRHFPKRVRFVTAIVFPNWKHQPGIAQKKRIWPESGASLI